MSIVVKLAMRLVPIVVRARRLVPSLDVAHNFSYCHYSRVLKQGTFLRSFVVIPNLDILLPAEHKLSPFHVFAVKGYVLFRQYR